MFYEYGWSIYFRALSQCTTCEGRQEMCSVPIVKEATIDYY
jgi:hypothetical protein